MTILYKHLRTKNDFDEIVSRGGLTVAVEGMTLEKFKTSLENIFNKDFFVKVNIGFSVCSSQDNFVKKTGRELSVSRLKPFNLKPIAVVKNEMLFIIEGTNQILSFALTPRQNIILTQLLTDN